MANSTSYLYGDAYWQQWQHDDTQRSYHYGASTLFDLQQAALILAAHETPQLCVSDDEARQLAGRLADTLLHSSTWASAAEVIGFDLARRAAVFMMLVQWQREG